MSQGISTAVDDVSEVAVTTAQTVISGVTEVLGASVEGVSQAVVSSMQTVLGESGLLLVK